MSSLSAYRHFWPYGLIWSGIIALFLLQHRLLEDASLYQRTTGTFMLNYLRQGGWEDPQIVKAPLPYVPISEDNLSNWDAAIYACIRDHGYRTGFNCYDSFRPSFMPAFPLLWRFSHLNFREIAVLNYFLFGLSLLILFDLFKIPHRQAYWLFALLLTLPNAIIFAMPYSEALFLLSGLMASWAFVKKRTLLFFIAFYLLMLSRVASLFIFLALLASTFFYFSAAAQRKWSALRFPGLASAATVLAYLTYFLMVYFDTGSFDAYFRATKIDQDFLRWPSGISDWSKESLGLSLSALLAVVLPSLGILIRCLFKSNRNRSELIGLTAALYFAGLCVFQALHSGGNLHSFHRFIICSPPFFLLFFQSKFFSSKVYRAWLALSFAGALVIAYSIPYAGKWQPEMTGMLLLPLSLFFISLFKGAEARWYWKLAAVLNILVNFWWNGYLFNQYLSNAWIFT